MRPQIKGNLEERLVLQREMQGKYQRILLYVPVGVQRSAQQRNENGKLENGNKLIFLFFVHRPNTSKIFPSRKNKGLSTYQTDFNDKDVRKSGAIRAGDAFGEGRNNPHPSEVRNRDLWHFSFTIDKEDSFATRLTCLSGF